MDIYNVILFTICFLFFIFASHLLVAKKTNRTLAWLLSLIIFSRIGQMVIFLSVRNNYMEVFPWVYKLFTPLYYLTPAAFYLYVVRFLDYRQPRRFKYILHFLPFVIAIIHFLPWNIQPPVSWSILADHIESNTQIFMVQRTGLFPAIFFSTLRIVLMLGYLTATWFAFIRSGLFTQKSWTNGKTWISFILSLATVVQLLAFLPMWITQGTKAHPWFITVNCCVLILVILYLLHKPGLLYTYLMVNVKKEQNAGAKKERVVKAMPEVGTIIENYQGVGRDDLEKLMQEKQLFLEPNLQIKDLANEIGFPVHQCSYLINNIIGKNFRDWINAYRILFFITVYPDKKHHKTIEAMANEAGFKSLATFYKAFKKETGLMPRQYFSDKEAP